MSQVRIDKAIEVLAAIRGLELELARLVARLDKKRHFFHDLIHGMSREEREAFQMAARGRRLWG